MSIYENENRPESAERAIQVTNCTIYVGRVEIVVDPRLNSDCTSYAETRAAEDHNGSSVNTSPKQTNFVSARSTKPRIQRQSITTPYAARPKIIKVGPTSRQKSVCQRPATSQLSCCLHGVGRCNYEARFGAGSDNCTAGSDNCIAGTDDCNAAARNGDPSRRNRGRLSPLRLGSRDQNVTKSNWPSPFKMPATCLCQVKPPVRQDRPVDLYAGSRLPVPVRPGPVAARILRIERAVHVRPPSQNDGRSDRRCATADKPHDTDDKPGDKPDDKSDDTNDKPDDTNDKPDDKPDDTNDKSDDKPDDTNDKPHDVVDLLEYDDTAVEPHDVVDLLEYDDTAVEPHDVVDLLEYNDAAVEPHDIVDLLEYHDTAVEPGQPCVHIDESAASSTSKQGCSLQALDDRSSTAGSQPVAVESDSLSDASDQPFLEPVDQNESDMTVPTFKPVIDDDDSQPNNVHSSGHQSATV